MFCKYCGTSVPDHVKFCPACGKPSGNPGNTGRKPAGPAIQPSGAKPYRPAHAAVSGTVPGGKSYNIGNYIFWAGCAMTLISVFLPYCSASAFGIGGSMSLMDMRKLIKPFYAEGAQYILLFMVICAGMAAGLAVVNFFKLNIVSVAGSALLAGLVLYVNQYVSERLSSLSNVSSISNLLLGAMDVNARAAVDFEIGHTLLMAGSIIMLCSAVAALVIAAVKKKAA